MSTVEADVEIPGAPAALGEPELTAARVARVGDIEVRRLMPLRRRRSVGAWCFADHYGPMSVDGVAGMQVPPHPHIGLQTVTWLLDGNVLAARVLLHHAAGADLLVLGSATHRRPDGIGPVARACLRHAPCPVVVVSAAMTGVAVPA